MCNLADEPHNYEALSSDGDLDTEDHCSFDHAFGHVGIAMHTSTTQPAGSFLQLTLVIQKSSTALTHVHIQHT